MSDTSTINQVCFNKLSAEYDTRNHAAISALDREVRARINDFIQVKPGGRLLDYACGTGVLTQALGDGLGQCIGIDLSENMVKAFNTKAKNQGFTPDTRSAYQGNLTLASDPSPAGLASATFFNFDIAAAGLCFHHFDDPDLAARRLAERLRPGTGVLFVVDFMPHAGRPDDRASFGVVHPGFSEERMRSVFESAGVGGDFRFEEVEAGLVFENAHGDGEDVRRNVFFARGTKV